MFMKNIDNSHHLDYLSVTDFNFEGAIRGLGNVFTQSGANGEMSLKPSWGDRNILCGYDQLDGYRTSTTIARAITIAATLTPVVSQNDPCTFILLNNTFETETLNLTDGMQITGSACGGLYTVILTAPLLIELGHPTGIFINMISGQVQTNEVIINGLNLCNYLVVVEGTVTNSLMTNTVCIGSGLAGSALTDQAAITLKTGSTFIINEFFFFSADFSPLGSFNLTIEGFCVRVQNGAQLNSQAVLIYPLLFPSFPALNGEPFNFLEIQTGGYALLNSYVSHDILTVCYVDGGTLLVQGGTNERNDIVYDVYSTSQTATLNIIGSYCDASVNYDLRVNDAISVVQVQASVMNQDFFGLPADQSNILLSYTERSLDNARGLHSTGTITFGSHTSASNIYLGQGSIEQGDQIFLKYNGATYTDVSNDLRLSVMTSTTVFDSVAAGNIFYVGENDKFSTTVLNVTTATVRGAGTIVIEYWNGAAWTSFKTMTTSANVPYYSNANEIATIVGGFATRFDITLLQGTNWQTTTVNGNTAYFVRIRITVAITTSPVINSLYLLTNTSRFDPQGIRLNYGLNRTIKTIQQDISTLKGQTVGNQTIWASTILRVSITENYFSVGDTTAFCLYLPADVDTSCFYTLNIGYVHSTSGAAVAAHSFTITYSPIGANERVYLASPVATTAARQKTQTVAFPFNATNAQLLQFVTVNFDLSDMKIRTSTGALNDILFCHIERAAGGVGVTTFVQISSSFYSWVDGAVIS